MKQCTRRTFLRTNAYLGAAVAAGALLPGASGRAAFAAQAPIDDGFVRLEGGLATIGSPETERQRSSDEVRHQVRISPFLR